VTALESARPAARCLDVRPPALVVIIALAAATAAARADEFVDVGHPVEVGGGYVLDVDRRGLRVRQGKRRAPLTIAGGRPSPHATSRSCAAVPPSRSASCRPAGTSARRSRPIGSRPGWRTRPAWRCGAAIPTALAELIRAHALTLLRPAASELAGP
jgi:hypothetical protein